MARFGFGILICLTGAIATAVAQDPKVISTSPGAAAPGKTTEVTLIGEQFAAPSGVWTNFPATAEVLASPPPEPGRAACRLTIPADCPVGIYALRLATQRGVSNPRLFVVDDLPSVASSEKNAAPAAAQEIPLPVAVDGQCEPAAADYFKIKVAAGQRLSLEVLAARIGSQLDPTVRVLDMAGGQLAASDDEPGLGADCRLRHTFAAAGEYLVEVRDSAYRGGPNHRYRLRLGDFPLTTALFPLAAIAGGSAERAVLGPAVEGAAVKLDLAGLAAGQLKRQGVTWAGGQGSAMLAVEVSDLPDVAEVEPNDAPEQAAPVALPGAWNGRLATPRDRDWWRFSARKGERWVFTGQTRGLGVATDLLLRLHNADGAPIVEADDAGTEEGTLDFTVPADGVYRLAVEDVLRRGGPELAYRIEVRAARAGFVLNLEADHFNAPAGGVFLAKVTAARRDYNGPITLGLDGVGDGFVVQDNVIPEGKNEATIRVTLPPRIAPGGFVTGKIVGRAKIGEAEFISAAHTLAMLRRDWPNTPYPPSDLDGAVAIGAGPPTPPFFELAAVAPVTFARSAGSAAIKLTAKRLDGQFGEPIAVAVENLPAGFSAEVKPIDKGQTETTITIKGPNDAAAATHTVRIRGRATFKNQPREVVLEAPLVVEAK